MKRSIGMILLAAALAGSGAAAAQDTQRPREPRAFSKPTERVEARLAYLKTALKITPAQEGPWDAYAQAARKEAAAREQKMAEWRQKRQAHKDGGQPGAMRHHPSALERLERQQKFLAAASARLSERIAAIKPLYEALGDEQKKVADVVLVHAGHGRSGHGRSHGMG